MRGGLHQASCGVQPEQHLLQSRRSCILRQRIYRARRPSRSLAQRLQTQQPSQTECQDEPPEQGDPRALPTHSMASIFHKCEIVIFEDGRQDFSWLDSHSSIWTVWETES